MHAMADLGELIVRKPIVARYVDEVLQEWHPRGKKRARYAMHTGLSCRR